MRSFIWAASYLPAFLLTVVDFSLTYTDHTVPPPDLVFQCGSMRDISANAELFNSFGHTVGSGSINMEQSIESAAHNCADLHTFDHASKKFRMAMQLLSREWIPDALVGVTLSFVAAELEGKKNHLLVCMEELDAAIDKELEAADLPSVDGLYDKVQKGLGRAILVGNAKLTKANMLTCHQAVSTFQGLLKESAHDLSNNTQTRGVIGHHLIDGTIQLGSSYATRWQMHRYLDDLRAYLDQSEFSVIFNN